MEAVDPLQEASNSNGDGDAELPPSPSPSPSPPPVPVEPPKASILLGGEDAMDEDELLDTDNAGVTPLSSTTSTELISTIITPSPFPHHTTGPTSSRFRNAFTRITTHPESDVEAWQALITEVNACYRSMIQSGNSSKIHTVDAEIQLQLDWIESCYGRLLTYFPYSATHYAAVAEILVAQSARVGEEDGPLVADYGVDTVRRQNCQSKLEHVFETTLGIAMDGTTPISMEHHKNDDQNNGEEAADEDDTAVAIGGMLSSSVELWLLYIKTRIRQAHRQFPNNNDEKSIRQWSTKAYELALENAGFCFNNHLLWRQYLAYAKAQSADPQHMVHLRSIYQRLVCHPMTGLDQLWQEYEAFERQQSEALAAALVSEYTPKYQHARTVYLERNRVFNVQDLQITKLATPPNLEEEDLPEEYQTMQLWKKRTAYERTNPERLSPPDLAHRVRSAYKEMVCVWTQHPEVWHMWSMWEETSSSSSAGGVGRAISVLQTSQTHIPDCTLLAYAQAQLVEWHTTPSSDCLGVMEGFLERAPNTLGFALYQQMVRRYKGMEGARAVFAKARRVLKVQEEATKGSTTEKNKANANPETGEEAQDGIKEEEEENGKRWMVTNRLDPSIGVSGSSNDKNGAPNDTTNNDDDDDKIQPGSITWHLYAAHATIEHRLNKSPETAARVYELGLRKHGSFLTKPAYVLRYAQLLMELQDTVNLRALLTRALAACSNPQDTKHNPSVAALWDMTLQFESFVSIADPTNVQAAIAVERRRRAALMGPEVEDVATGSRVGLPESSVGIGAQKSTVAEQLVRQDGYDMSSMIVNGMSRTVDTLDVMGLWGNGIASSSNARLFSKAITAEEDNDTTTLPGGKSDAAFQRRLQFARLAAMGGGTVDAVDQSAMGLSSNKLLSARERLAQQTVNMAPGQQQNTAMTMAIQQSPDWLRALLVLLPASRMRTPVVSKPPPHLTEMALAALRVNNLPAERPRDNKTNVSGNKHKLKNSGGGGGGGGGDSSDEENGPRGSGGYGTHFRARQRARQMAGQSNGIKSEQ